MDDCRIYGLPFRKEGKGIRKKLAIANKNPTIVTANIFSINLIIWIQIVVSSRERGKDWCPLAFWITMRNNAESDLKSPNEHSEWSQSRTGAGVQESTHYNGRTQHMLLRMFQEGVFGGLFNNSAEEPVCCWVLKLQQPRSVLPAMASQVSSICSAIHHDVSQTFTMIGRLLYPSTYECIFTLVLIAQLK